MEKPSYLKLIKGVELDPAEERRLLKSLDPASLPHVCELLANQKRQHRAALEKVRKEKAELEAVLSGLRSPPLHPATVLCVYGNGQVDLVVAGRRQVVGTAPEVPSGSLHPGDEVFLNADLALVVAKNEETARTGQLGTVAEMMNGTPVIRGVNDEEIMAMCAPELAASIKAGDRVLYTRGFPCVIERLPERSDSSYLLEEPPAISFDCIGGLDEVAGEIRRDLNLFIQHRHLLELFRLRPIRGIMLVGPPGIGKNMLGAGIANHLAHSGTDARFLHVAPGALRSMWYGGSEARIRELFAVARAAPGLVVIFFDEIDAFGARGAGIGQDIDGRVLGTLLSEIDGLESAPNVLCVGATNRLDLCDPALVREGRFGDRIYRIPRPGRRATRQIFAKYLREDLPYASNGNGSGAGLLIDAAVSYLYAQEGGVGSLATATLADGSLREIKARDVMSGALIASAVERAKRSAAERHLDGGSGITLEDMLEALDDALASAAHKINAPQAARQSLDFPRADEIVRVDPAPERHMRRHRYIRAT